MTGVAVNAELIQGATVRATIFRAGRCAEHADLVKYPEAVPCEDCAGVIVGVEPQGIVACYHKHRIDSLRCPGCRARLAGRFIGRVRIKGIHFR